MPFPTSRTGLSHLPRGEALHAGGKGISHSGISSVLQDRIEKPSEMNRHATCRLPRLLLTAKAKLHPAISGHVFQHSMMVNSDGPNRLMRTDSRRILLSHPREGEQEGEVVPLLSQNAEFKRPRTVNRTFPSLMDVCRPPLCSRRTQLDKANRAVIAVLLSGQEEEYRVPPSTEGLGPRSVDSDSARRSSIAAGNIAPWAINVPYESLLERCRWAGRSTALRPTDRVWN